LKWQRLKPYEKFAQMIDRHWDGIAAYCKPENKVDAVLKAAVCLAESAGLKAIGNERCTMAVCISCDSPRNAVGAE
jgi:hypothetical protein